MIDRVPITDLKQLPHMKTLELEEDEYFVIDTGKYKDEIDRAILSMGENSDADSIFTALIKGKIKATPPDLAVTISQLNKLSRSSQNMSGYINSVIAQITVHDKFLVNKPLKLVPTLLVGPPGCGKTYIATQIAKALGIWHDDISLSQATESFVLAGCPKGYSTTTPGDIARRMAKSDCINPLLILDELDKASFYPSGRPAITGPLLQILEADTAVKFEDACLKCELDVSHVSWLATANDISQVPAPILSRFHIIHVGEAEDQEKVWQIQRLARSVTDEMGLRTYVTTEVARDALKDYLHLSIREWKMKLQLAIVMKVCDSYRGDHIVIRTEDMKPLVHEEKKRRIGFV